MKKFFTYLSLMIILNSTLVLPLVRASDYNFQDSVEYANFTRIWLAICPKIMRLSGSDLEKAYSNMSKEHREISIKICTQNIESDVKSFLRYLITINIFGSFDIKHQDYNLPGTSIDTTYVDRGLREHQFTFLNDGIEVYLDRYYRVSTHNNLEITLKNIANDNHVNQITNEILNACASPIRSTFQRCNDILNINDANNNNIFSTNNLSSIYLQQMHFNTLTNANNFTEINNYIQSNNIKTIEISDDFRENILNPTIEFGENHDFGLQAISQNSALNNVKNYLVPGGLGWLFDMVAELSTNAAEGLYKTLIMRRLQSITPNSNVHHAWKNFRNIANIILIILFLIIIISQLTNIGLTNYSIKILLPKIIIGVILVNTSFIISQILIDLSNIVGDGLFNIMVDPTEIKSGFVQHYENFRAMNGLISSLLSIIMLIFASLLAIIASVINLVLLAIRDTLVVMAIILSPIALVSTAFPAMNSLFKVWWKTLSAALMLFPIISLLVGGSILVDHVISSSSGVNLITFIMGKLAMFGALVITPFVAISSLRKIESTISQGATGFTSTLPQNPQNATSIGYKKYKQSYHYKVRFDLRKQNKLNKLSRKMGSFWGLAAHQARTSINKQNQGIASNYTQSEAEQAINALYDHPIRPKTTATNQASIDVFKYDIKRVNRKDHALSLALAHVKDNSAERTTNALTILKALSVAHKNGASQSELHNVMTNILGELDQKGDFRTIGVLKGYTKFKNSYGDFDQNLLQSLKPIPEAATANSKEKDTSEDTQDPYNAIYTETKKSLMERGFHNPDQQKSISQISPNTVKRGTIANQVFNEYLDQFNPQNLADTTANLKHRLSIDVQKELNLGKQNTPAQNNNSNKNQTKS